jgi:CRP/FNR family cyclic AMP-dependent transcriptional regulator
MPSFDMQALKVLFEIVEDNNCPLYEEGEFLTLSDKSLLCPEQKPTCLILVREMTQLLFRILGDPESFHKGTQTLFSCSGCSGLIKFRKVAEGSAEETADRLSDSQQLLYQRIRNYPIFVVIDEERLQQFVGQFRQATITPGTLLIKKGEPSMDLYVVLSGELTVSDGPVFIASLGQGDICGEMSYLGNDVASATVKASTEAEYLAISGREFNRLLDQQPTLQLFMARLLAERLSIANKARSADFNSCMHGRINEMLPAELFQIFHMNRKTGCLSLELPKGMAKVSFREGCIINASYLEKANEDAIFEILREKEGYYRFTLGLSPQEMKAGEVGDFMALLMEGIKRVDEEHGRPEDLGDL